MAPEFTEKTLVERAVTLLQSMPDGRKADTELLTWIQAVHRYGFAEACTRRRKLAGRFSDWSVTEAISVIHADPQWGTRQQKIEAVAEILTARKTKAEIRAIATSKHGPDAGSGA